MADHLRVFKTAEDMLRRAQRSLEDLTTRISSARTRHEAELVDLKARQMKEIQDLELSRKETEGHLVALSKAFAMMDTLKPIVEEAFAKLDPEDLRRVIASTSLQTSSWGFQVVALREVNEPRRRITTEWRRWLGMLPVAPDEGIRVGDFIEMVLNDKPDVVPRNIRAQLSHLKHKRGWVENTDGRWRLTKPLHELLGRDDEIGDDGEPSDPVEEAGSGLLPSPASDVNQPLPALTS
jgi:hypothetical protein